MSSPPLPDSKPPREPTQGKATADASPGGRSAPLSPSPIKRTRSSVAPALPPSPIKRPSSHTGSTTSAEGGRDLLEGATFGKVKLLRRIGHGGMGDVYLGEHSLLQRQVAVKVLPKEFTREEELLARFRREAIACAKLEHPNIVQVYDIGNEGEAWYIVLSYVDGRSLQELLDEARGPMDLKEAVRIGAGVARGLQAAHEAGIVHRDVKPANILVSKKGEVKITDFGLAYDQENKSLVTMPGTMMGTPHFMSPEQAGGRRADARSDIYSLGVMLYYAVTGHRPFVGDSHMVVLFKHQNETPQPVRKLNPQVPEYVARIIARCMSKRPEQRYQSCAELAKDLEGTLDGAHARQATPPAVPAAQAPLRPVRPASTSRHLATENQMGTARRKKAPRLAVFALSLAAMVALIGLLIYAIALQNREHDRRPSEERKGATASVSVSPKNAPAPQPDPEPGFAPVLDDLSAVQQKLYTCCGKMILADSDDVLEVRVPPEADIKRHFLTLKDTDYADLVLHAEVKWLEGNDLLVIGRQLHQQEAEKRGQPTSFIQVNLQKLLPKGEWRPLEFEINRGSVNARVGEKSVSVPLSGVANSGRVGFMVQTGTAFLIRKMRVKVLRREP